MIVFFAPGKPAAPLTSSDLCAGLAREAIWIDVLEPTAEEEQTLEAALSLNIPTREEMQEIELSSRLYEEDGALFMTATVLTHADTSMPQSSAVTFIIARNKLVTLRYIDPVPFQAFPKRREANLQRYQTPGQFLCGLVDSIVERVADILENVGTQLDSLSHKVFEPGADAVPSATTNRLAHSPRGHARKTRQRDFVEVLQRIGAASDLVSRARESLVSFTRLVAFYREMQKGDADNSQGLAHFKTINGDLSALSDHASFLSSKISFLLDATLGMINNEQNAIIKILSVAALVFLPPTLVAGIYGMNFHILPELNWHFGYPFALVIMFASAILPYLWFKWRGWL